MSIDCMKGGFVVSMHYPFIPVYYIDYIILHSRPSDRTMQTLLCSSYFESSLSDLPCFFGEPQPPLSTPPRVGYSQFEYEAPPLVTAEACHRSRATAFHINSPRLYYDLSYMDGWDSGVDVILGHTAHVEGCVPLFQ